VIWWSSLVVWVSLGLLGLGWLPPTHHSWSRGERIVLWTIALFVCAALGPLGLWQMIRLDRQERRIRGAFTRAASRSCSGVLRPDDDP
jgi:hypothetical protein